MRLDQREGTVKSFVAVLTFLCVGLLQPLAEAQLASREYILPLYSAITTALRLHPGLNASDALVQAAEYRVDQATGGYLPQLNFNTSYTL